ncbi:MAG: hypothetical protein WAN92_00265 [Herbaspirillum sp.]
MQSFSGKTSHLLAICIVLPGLLPLTAAAQAYGTPDKPSFDQRYSSGAAMSVEDADAILAEAGKEREVINDQHIDDQRACYHRFFASSCLEDARERNRIALKQVREVEVAARARRRQIMADDHDKALAGQQKAASETRQQRLSDRRHQSEGQAGSRVKAHQAQLRRKQADEAARAPQHAANEQAYQKKIQQAEARRKKIEVRKQKKCISTLPQLLRPQHKTNESSLKS